MNGKIRFGSVCSGIEAASVAWHPLGWEAAWLSEIEPFPCAVLKHHYPQVPNLGDMTLLPNRIASGEVEAPDVFCGGTPCQAFSVAGLRHSLDDSRGNLSLIFCEIANAIDNIRLIQQSNPAIIFWENVPGVLNTKDNAFGCFLAGLAGESDALIPSGGRWTDAGFIDGPKRAVAWRVLDAQYFGVAQRRKRVFVVASARADFDPAAVLFEFDGVRRDSAPSREAGQAVAPTIAGCANGGGANGPGRDVDSVESLQISMCLNAGGMGRLDAESETLLPIALQDVTPREKAQNGKGWNDDGTSYTVDTAATQGVMQPIGWSEELTASIDLAGTIQRGGAGGRHDGVMQPNMAVRRLTPVECERLQGFPDGYTNIKDKCPDGPRYKALGNSWAVPVVRWIGERIDRALA